MDARQQKARIILATDGITWSLGTYRVRSQSKPGAYSVRLDGLFPTCSCDDFDLTHCECKHIIAARMWRDQQNAPTPPQPEPSAPVVPPEMPKRKTYKQPWREYNLAQTREGDHFQELLADLCANIPDAAPKGGKKGGRPTVRARDAAFLSVYRVYCGMSARRFDSDVRAAHERGHISKAVSFSSVVKAMENESLTPILHDLIRRSAAPLAAVESDFATDSTGFATNTYTRWFDVKWGQKELQHWVKPHIVTGVKTNCIAACEIHDKHTNDCNVLPSLTATTAQTFDVREMSADKAYLASNNFNAVAAVGGTFYPAFKNNTTGAVGGLYEKMWHLFCANKEDYLAHYHKRSNVESTFSAVKRLFGEMVRSKTDTAQKNEVLCKFIAYNVTCLIHAAYELGITPPGWNRDEPESDAPAILKFPTVA